MQSSDIVFDTSSGISLEEQKEILAGLNAMAGGSRLDPEPVAAEAKKKDYHFPLIINIGAVLFLGLGSLMFTFFHDRDESVIRESSSSLGITERMLIQEIRQETNRLIGEKEKQISDTLLKLSAVDAEYRLLQGSVETLTQAQRERAAALLIIQEEYRSTLSHLEDEKTKILEDSRLREAALRAQAEARVDALSSQLEQGEANLSAAMQELARLGTEQQRIGRIESQMSGFYRTLENQISIGRIADAHSSLEAMKDFIDAPAVMGIKAFEARRQAYLVSIAALEKAIAAEGGDSSQDGIVAELRARNASLERDLAAFSSQGSDQIRIISEYVAAIQELEITNAEQTEAINQRESDIRNLRTEITRKEQEVSGLNTDMSLLRTQNEDLQRRMDAAIKAFTGE